MRAVAAPLVRLLIPLVLFVASPAPAMAQSAVLDGPAELLLPTLTPAFTARANGFGAERPLRYTLQAATGPDFQTLVLDTTFTSNETVVPVQITRPLLSEAVLFFRLRVRAGNGPNVDSPTFGPRTVPTWLTLVSPNSSRGDQVDTRRPVFVWKSARVTPATGPWRYDVEVTTRSGAVSVTSGITDTTFQVNVDLETNASYRWGVRAYLPKGEDVRVQSLSTFGVADPAVPTVTLLFQNFPNPFPTAAAANTCFWFDIAEPGGRVSLDVLDIRGNLVRTLVPGPDGEREFPPGRYGRGAPGTGTNCDGRFIWDATGNDRRTVAPGVYYARFRLGNAAPIIRSMLFRGR
ncbi:MAG TPA: hypothetical protein VE869_14750 [Gemmatimonas sp.]|nr:hypothetical protein [Gemmatimonas sp.]